MHRVVLPLVATLLSTTALAQSDGMSRPGAEPTVDAPTERTPDTPTTPGTTADVAGCSEYLVPAHREVVELRYIAEAMPAGSLKRELAGRLDVLERDTASALGSVCGVRELDRTPPRTFETLDLSTVAGTVGTVFGNPIEINDGGFLVSAAQLAIDSITGGSRKQTRRQRRRGEAPSMARGAAPSADDVDGIIAHIAAAPFADEKRAVLTTHTAGKAFTSAQVARLVAAMPFSEQRIPVAVQLYPQTTDPDVFVTTVSAVLPFASERSELRAAVGQ